MYIKVSEFVSGEYQDHVYHFYPTEAYKIGENISEGLAAFLVKQGVAREVPDEVINPQPKQPEKQPKKPNDKAIFIRMLAGAAGPNGNFDRDTILEVGQDIPEDVAKGFLENKIARVVPKENIPLRDKTIEVKLWVAKSEIEELIGEPLKGDNKIAIILDTGAISGLYNAKKFIPINRGKDGKNEQK